jgi:hypothetical protein
MADICMSGVLLAWPSMRPMAWRITDAITCCTAATPRLADCSRMKPAVARLSARMK